MIIITFLPHKKLSFDLQKQRDVFTFDYPNWINWRADIYRYKLDVRNVFHYGL